MWVASYAENTGVSAGLHCETRGCIASVRSAEVRTHASTAISPSGPGRGSSCGWSVIVCLPARREEPSESSRHRTPVNPVCPATFDSISLPPLPHDSATGEEDEAWRDDLARDRRPRPRALRRRLPHRVLRAARRPPAPAHRHPRVRRHHRRHGGARRRPHRRPAHPVAGLLLPPHPLRRQPDGHLRDPREHDRGDGGRPGEGRLRQGPDPQRPRRQPGRHAGRPAGPARAPHGGPRLRRLLVGGGAGGAGRGAHRRTGRLRPRRRDRDLADAAPPPGPGAPPRPDRGGVRAASAHESEVQRFHMLEEVSPRGHFGDPTAASAEKGERMLGAIVDSLCGIVDDILSGRLEPQPAREP